MKGDGSNGLATVPLLFTSKTDSWYTCTTSLRRDSNLGR